MIELKNVSFSYTVDSDISFLKNINLRIESGELVLLSGESGCGKTTVTRLLNGLIPKYYEGKLEGDICIDGESILELELYDVSRYSGSVFQNPRAQFFNVDTDSEFAFECENQGMPVDEIKCRVDRNLDDLNATRLKGRSIFNLSGGEKQKVACVSATVAGPDIMILDEPSSNLDMAATRDLKKCIQKWKEQGKTIIIAEHRLAYLMDLADRIVYLRDGRIDREFTPDELMGMSAETMQSLGLRPVTQEQFILKKRFENTGREAEYMKLSNYYFSYDGYKKILDIDEARVKAREVVAIIGNNGAGKTTFARCLMGLQKRFRGLTEVDGVSCKRRKNLKRSFMVMQDVNHKLFTESVLDEVLISMKDEDEKRAEEILKKLDLYEFKDRHPMSLSGGQKQRVAIACAIASDKETLIFDEPTSGLDLRHMLEVSENIDELNKLHKNIFIISHDMEFILRCCTAVIRMENGSMKEQYDLDEKGIERITEWFGRKTRAGSEVDSHKPEQIGNSAFGKVMDYAGKNKKLIYLAVVFIAFASICSVVPYFLSYTLIENIIADKAFGMNQVLVTLTGIAAALLGNAIFYSIGLSLSHKGAYRTLENIRVWAKNRLEKLPMGKIENLGVGALRKIFTDDIETMEVPLAHAIPEGIGNLTAVLFVYVAIFIINGKMGFLSLASFPIGFLLMFIMYKIGLAKMDTFYQAAKRMNNTIIEYINGMEVIKIFNRDGESYKRYRKDVDSYRDYTLDWYRISWPFMAAYGAILPCITLITLPLGAYMVYRGAVSFSDYIIVMMLSYAVSKPLMKSTSFMGTLPQINYKIEEIEKLLQFKPLNYGDKELENADADITFDNVSFAYEDSEVLHDINLTVPRGKMTALVGESGSGKSTLAKLLVHFYDPTEGRIRIGNESLSDISLESLNENISFVSQEQFLFNTSLLENIRIGKATAGFEEIYEAARKAECLEFIDKLPNGFHTTAGDCGKMLSGGQRQRISIARAILKDAPIIILDEATAFVDPENEEKMNRAISQVIKDKTVLVIGHRLQSLRNADQIVLLHKGRIEALGTHEELLNSSNLYQNMWKVSEETARWEIGR